MLHRGLRLAAGANLRGGGPGRCQTIDVRAQKGCRTLLGGAQERVGVFAASTEDQSSAEPIGSCNAGAPGVPWKRKSLQIGRPRLLTAHSKGAKTTSYGIPPCAESGISIAPKQCILRMSISVQCRTEMVALPQGNQRERIRSREAKK
jgi:hypothetical protein